MGTKCCANKSLKWQTKHTNREIENSNTRKTKQIWSLEILQQSKFNKFCAIFMSVNIFRILFLIV